MEPVTRKEHFLARIAGKPHDESLFPITREEFFLNDVFKSSLIALSRVDVIVPETVTFATSQHSEGPSEATEAKVPSGLVSGTVVTTFTPTFADTGGAGNYLQPYQALLVDDVEVARFTKNGVVDEESQGWTVEFDDSDFIITYEGFDYAAYLGEHTVRIQWVLAKPSPAFVRTLQVLLVDAGVIDGSSEKEEEGGKA